MVTVLHVEQDDVKTRPNTSTTSSPYKAFASLENAQCSASSQARAGGYNLLNRVDPSCYVSAPENPHLICHSCVGLTSFSFPGLLMDPPTTTQTEVLIIGAGPAGLIAAKALSQLGIDVRIIDKRLPGESAGHADGIQPRTIEIWDSLGLGEDLRRMGSHVYRFATYGPRDDGKGVQKTSDAANIPLPSARYPYEVLAPIQIIEGIITNALRSAGVSIDQPFVPQSLEILPASCENEEYPVEVVLHKLDAEYLKKHNISQDARRELASMPECIERVERVRAKYVIGSDGAHSWVRKTLDILMEGDAVEAEWGVVDFTPVTDLPTIRAKNVVNSPGGVVGFVPRPNNTVRAYVQLGNGSSTAGRDIKSLIFNAIQSAMKPYTMSFQDITWLNIYRVSHRVAARFSDAQNRVFIVGDACHVHSPKGGQGANTSMTDAINLSWKLARVLRGLSSPKLLATYEEERRKHSLDLIQFDKELLRAIEGDQDEYARLWKHDILFASGIGVKYASTLSIPLFQDLAPGIPIGERFPSATLLRACDWNPCQTLDLLAFDKHFKLLLLPGSVCAGNVSRLTALQEFVKELEMTSGFEETVDVFMVLDQPEVDDEVVKQLPVVATAKHALYVDAVWHGTAPRAPCTGFYERLGISSKQGVAVLVRPDCHVSMMVPITKMDAHHVSAFLSGL
ncbi:putative phenol hydroxylase, C-terminal dimerisation domain [Lyophyllum shimeji]|uniref:Phenol hydroxylase, C-terminal dimerisation domain n=1 Tax=Lyophyllum shimeji TaxID=47721 RepID=A0A9P3ULV3_LYOSH|nr:putative phenol hydroxylase, C-terminal dimerisation domain [Lyophyllum shimeji]